MTTHAVATEVFTRKVNRRLHLNTFNETACTSLHKRFPKETPKLFIPRVYSTIIGYV